MTINQVPELKISLTMRLEKEGEPTKIYEVPYIRVGPDTFYDYFADTIRDTELVISNHEELTTTPGTYLERSRPGRSFLEINLAGCLVDDEDRGYMYLIRDPEKDHRLKQIIKATDHVAVWVCMCEKTGVGTIPETLDGLVDVEKRAKSNHNQHARRMSKDN